MARILPLSDLVIGRIAAGESIVRPASVVKELVDNSLDAGATSIQVEVQGGGVRLVRVRDDGEGIAREDLPLALQRHATSKLQRAEDLERIVTMGFRGEGLASVASVARLVLTSRTEHDAHASSIEADHGTLHAAKPAAGTVGTTVEVSNLFGQVPGRRKFLKAEATEWGHIEEVLRHAALAHPQVAFSWSHNERVRARYPSASLEQRLAAVLGEALVRNAARIDAQSSDANVKVHGVLSEAGSLPSVLFVNERPVRDKMVTHALHEAYQQALGRERSGTWCLFLNVDPSTVDVNVHPTKSEVRFRDSSALHTFLTHAIVPVLRERFAVDPRMNLVATHGSSAEPGGSSPAHDGSTDAQRRSDGAPLRAGAGTEDGAVRASGAWYAPWLHARTGDRPIEARSSDPGQAPEHGALAQGNVAPLGTGTQDGRSDDPSEGQVVAVLHGRFVVVEHPEGMQVIDRQDVHQQGVVLALAHGLRTDRALVAQPLMVPVVVRVNEDPGRAALDAALLLNVHHERLVRWGLDLSAPAPHQVLVRALPGLPRDMAGQWDVAAVGLSVVKGLHEHGETFDDARLTTLLSQHHHPAMPFTMAEATAWVDRAQALNTSGLGVRWSWSKLAHLVQTGDGPGERTGVVKL